MTFDAWLNVSVQLGDIQLRGWIVVLICSAILNAVFGD